MVSLTHLKKWFLRSTISSLNKFPKREQSRSAKDEVRKASKQFYAALNRMLNGDAGPLEDIWSHKAIVTTMHPIGGRVGFSSKIMGRGSQIGI